MYPNGIKQQPHQRVDEPVPFTVDWQVPLQHQFVPRLEQHQRLCKGAANEYPTRQLVVAHYIMRPAIKGQTGFEERPWSSSECQRNWVAAELKASRQGPKQLVLGLRGSL